jgi:predicted membrane channel-forming protein YqfA (hemolysin III family)
MRASDDSPLSLGGTSQQMVVKLLGALAIVIAASLAVAALLGLLVTPWATIGMSLFAIALLALHKRRPVRIRKGDFDVKVHHRASDGDD